MKDFLGNEIKLGDVVITNDIHYRDFVKGEIIKINDKTISIKLKYESYIKRVNDITRRFPSQVVVIKNTK